MSATTAPVSTAPIAGAQDPEQALETLTALVRDDLEACNRLIVERMQSPVALIPQLAAHLVAAGGKRIRPLLTLAAARLCGHRGGRHVALAACVEFIHTATLLHDDVVDESALRRGAPSANAVFGNKPSVLVGDFLFARAFQIMVADGSLRVLDILATASATIAEGEVLQLVTQNDTATTEDQYLQVIEGKTAALFAAATEVGAVVADRPQAEAEALREYGRSLGVAFQLVDDALDYSASQAALGKTVGDDFREGKITLPVLLAFNSAGEEEKVFWRRVLEEREQAEGDLEKAIALMQSRGTLEATIERARLYGNRALDALRIFPDGPERRALAGIVEFCIARAR
ncbi:polyprenyl synthetase family protein [Muricoccus pecuniae]|uniref:Octaprenyl diphosphate synthase n=1 Tax=Muricoccus pecuniae TaxID=693023 RepID=A0A840XY36_9PROT|nr:octaprenyl-diphosphate synthase [Roseomonas pecuniae]